MVVLIAHLNLPFPLLQFPVATGTKNHMCPGGEQPHLSRLSSGGRGLISEALAGLSASWRLQGGSASFASQLLELPTSLGCCPVSLSSNSAVWNLYDSLSAFTKASSPSL